MSAPVDNVKDKVEEAVDETQQTATDSVDEAKVKTEEEIKKVTPEQSSGGSG